MKSEMHILCFYSVRQRWKYVQHEKLCVYNGRWWQYTKNIQVSIKRFNSIGLNWTVRKSELFGYRSSFLSQQIHFFCILKRGLQRNEHFGVVFNIFWANLMFPKWIDLWLILGCFYQTSDLFHIPSIRIFETSNQTYQGCPTNKT